MLLSPYVTFHSRISVPFWNYISHAARNDHLSVSSRDKLTELYNYNFNPVPRINNINKTHRLPFHEESIFRIFEGHGIRRICEISMRVSQFLILILFRNKKEERTIFDLPFPFSGIRGEAR